MYIKELNPNITPIFLGDLIYSDADNLSSDEHILSTGGTIAIASKQVSEEDDTAYEFDLGQLQNLYKYYSTESRVIVYKELEQEVSAPYEVITFDYEKEDVGGEWIGDTTFSPNQDGIYQISVSITIVDEIDSFTTSPINMDLQVYDNTSRVMSDRDDWAWRVPQERFFKTYHCSGIIKLYTTSNLTVRFSWSNSSHAIRVTGSFGNSRRTFFNSYRIS